MDMYEKSGESLEGVLGLLLTDPLYNTMRERKQYNLEHDLLTNEEIQNITEVFQKVVQRGGNDLVFCASSQFQRWYQIFSNVKEHEEEHDEEHPDIKRLYRTCLYVGAEPVAFCP